MPMIADIETCLNEFKATLDADVKSLIDLHDAENQGAGRPGRWLEAIRRSGVVLLAANFENYCESTVCSSFSHLAAQGVFARRYPERYRHWLFREETHMRQIGIDAAPYYIVLSLKLYSDIRPLTPNELKLDRLKDQFANPTPTNINWLVGLFDVEAYLDGITLQVNGVDTEATTAIGELANRRNKIAHGDATEKPSGDDVKRLTKFCQLFANRFAKDISDLTQKCLQSAS